MLTIQKSIRKVEWDGTDVQLTHSQYRMLVLLVERKRMSYRDLYSVWRPIGPHVPDGGIAMNTNVRSSIKRIRNAFRSIDPKFKSILVLSAYGYEWSGEAKIIEPACECAAWIGEGYCCGKPGCPRTERANQGLEALRSLISISDEQITLAIDNLAEGRRRKWKNEWCKTLVLMLKELQWRRRAMGANKPRTEGDTDIGKMEEGSRPTSSSPTDETLAGTGATGSTSPSHTTASFRLPDLRDAPAVTKRSNN